MTTISLPPDLERPLIEAALRLGTTPEQLAVEALRQRFVSGGEETSVRLETLADCLAGYVAVVDGASEAYSERCGERFAEGLAESKGRAEP